MCAVQAIIDIYFTKCQWFKTIAQGFKNTDYYVFCSVLWIDDGASGRAGSDGGRGRGPSQLINLSLCLWRLREMGLCRRTGARLCWIWDAALLSYAGMLIR